MTFMESGPGRASSELTIPREVLDAASGAIAGGVARIVVSPLDVIKIRFQVQLEPITGQGTIRAATLAAHKSKYTGLLQATREIFREEGILGFWRGTIPGLLLVMPYTAIQFVVIHKCKSILAGSSSDEEHRRLRPELSFGVGAVAGVAATVGSYPFDLLRTVLASQGEPKVYKGMLDACRGIVRQQGIQGLFSGLSPTVAEIIPYAGMQLGCYDVFKKGLVSFRSLQASRWQAAVTGHHQAGALQTQQAHMPNSTAGPTHQPQEQQEQQLGSMDKFVCGLAAGTLAKAVCHPMDVVKKRFQVAGLVRDPRYGARVSLHAYNGMIDAIRKIAQQEGTAGLYKGLLPSLIKAAPAAAITFFMYELVSKWLETVCRKDLGKK